MTTKRVWILGTAVACLAVLAAGWFLLVSPQRHKAARLRAQAASQTMKQNELTTELAMLKAEARNLPAKEAQLARVLQFIPTTPALPSLIRQLSSATLSAGVDLTTISPGTPVVYGSTGTTAAASSTTTPGASGLYQIPLSLSLSGDYFAVENFLQNLETMHRALEVTSVSLAPVSGSGTGSTSPSSSGSSSSASSPTGEVSVTLAGQVYMTTNHFSGATQKG